MPIVELQFLIDQHGAEKVRAELGRLTGATKQAASAAVPLQSQLSKLGSAITGPLGVATGVALATKKLIDFGRAGATTRAQLDAFNKFDSSIAKVNESLENTAAKLLANTGALEMLGHAAEFAAEPFEILGKALERVGLAGDLASAALWLVEAPTRALRAGGEFLIDTLGDLADSFDDVAESAYRTSLTKPLEVGYNRLGISLSGYIDKQMDAVQATVEQNLKWQVWTTRAKSAASAVDSLSRSLSWQATLLGMGAEEGLSFYWGKVTQAAEEYQAKQNRGRGAPEDLLRLNEVMSDIAFNVGLVARETTSALPDAIDSVTAYGEAWSTVDGMQRGLRAVGTVLDRVSDKWSNFNDRLTESREAQEALDAATKKRNDAVWAGVEGGAALVKTIAGNAWVDAVLGAALETAKGIGTIISNPAESVTHFASAAQFLVAQAIAESKGGGSGAVSSAGAAAPAVSSAPRSVLDRNEQQDSETNLAIYVDGRVLGEVAATGINKAGRRGTAVLDRRTQGQRNSRRGLT